MVAGADRLGDLSGVAATLQVLLTHSLLDSVHLVLVALSVPHGALLGLLQRRLQRLEKINSFKIT